MTYNSVINDLFLVNLHSFILRMRDDIHSDDYPYLRAKFGLD